MHPLKDLAYSPKLKTDLLGSYVHCQVRKDWYKYTPEEDARQRFIAFLLEKKGYSRNHIKLEHRLTIGEKSYKADIVVYQDTIPAIVVECKRNDIALGHDVFAQVNNYNAILKAEWVVVTNGLEYTVRRYDKQTGKSVMVEDLPPKSWHSLTLDEYAKQKIALENQLFELQRLFIAQHCPYKVGDTIEQEGRLYTITKIILNDPVSLTESYIELSDRLENQKIRFSYELKSIH